MCGRFTLRTSLTEVGRLFGVVPPTGLIPRYNIAPTQLILGIRAVDGQREAAMFHWGLIPSWADDPKIGNRMINARSDSVPTSSAYRKSFKQRRCLIVADGFYEWRQSPPKQPFYFRRPDQQPFALAGLWDRWHRDEQTIESCTIITTDANATVEPVHHRMPVILSPEDYEAWLDPEFRNVEHLQSLLRPAPADVLQSIRVSTLVNNPRNETPACIEEEKELGDRI